MEPSGKTPAPASLTETPLGQPRDSPEVTPSFRHKRKWYFWNQHDGGGPEKSSQVWTSVERISNHSSSPENLRRRLRPWARTFTFGGLNRIFSDMQKCLIPLFPPCRHPLRVCPRVPHHHTHCPWQPPNIDKKQQQDIAVDSEDICSTINSACQGTSDARRTTGAPHPPTEQHTPSKK